MYGLGVIDAGYDNTQSTPNDSNSSIDKIGHMRNATLIYLNLTIQGKQTRKIIRKHTAQ